MPPNPAKHFTIARAETTNSRALGNGLLSVLLPSGATGGALALFELTVRSGAEPPRHAHRNRYTLFYILDGELEVHCDREVRGVRKGEAILLPPKAMHTYKVLSPKATFLVLMQPGSAIEEYFEAVSQPVATMELPQVPVRPPLNVGELQALAERYEFSFDLAQDD